MDDFETNPVGTAATLAELNGANGVHIPRAVSNQEMVEAEKMTADGKFQEAAQKFGGYVTYHQDQRDLPPMTDAELAMHLCGRLVPMSVAYRAASRIEQLVATVEQLESSLTRANAAAAAAYEVAAQIADNFVRMRERQIETEKSKSALHVDVLQIMRWQAGKVQSNAIADAIRALATPDQTAALDKLIAEAVKPWIEMAQECIALTQHPETTWDLPNRLVRRMNDAILAASKKGGA
jgi:hypothetical protein